MHDSYDRDVARMVRDVTMEHTHRSPDKVQVKKVSKKLPSNLSRKENKKNGAS